MNDKNKEDIQMKIFEMVEYIQENKLDIKEFELLEIIGEELNPHYGYKVRIDHISFNTSRDGIWGLSENSIHRELWVNHLPPDKEDHAIIFIYENLKINLRDIKIEKLLK